MSRLRPTRRGLLSLLLAVVVFLAFLPCLRGGFVWDDAQYVTDNPRVAAGLSAGGIRWALTATPTGSWHPLTWLSHILDVELFGLDPRGHHLVSVLLHAANAALLFLLLEGLTGARWRSLVAAGLFGLHPLHVESVAWVAERKDVLSTLFGLLALAAYARSLRKPGPARAAAVPLLFAAALAAKPMLVTLPLVMLLLDAWPLGRLTRTPASWRLPLLEKLPLLALSAAVSVATFQAQVAVGAYSHYPLGARVSNAIVSYARYLAKAAAPRDLAAYYPHPGTAMPAWQTLGALLALALLTAGAAAAVRRRPWLGVGWLWFAGTLVPVIGLVQAGQQAIADRYTYLPLAGIFVAAAWGAADLAGANRRVRVAAGCAGVAALLSLAAATVMQAGYWRDEERLFGHTLRVAPGNWMADFNLGAHHQRRGGLDLAEAHYRQALAARPGYEKALNNLGTIAQARGRSAEAVTLFQAALRSDPDFENAAYNLGAELAAQGRLAEATAFLEDAVRRSPGLSEARGLLAELLMRAGRLPEAEAQFVETLRRVPDSARARNWLGVVLARQGRYAEAAGQFREVLRAHPGDTDARANLERALSRLEPAGRAGGGAAP